MKQETHQKAQGKASVFGNYFTMLFTTVTLLVVVLIGHVIQQPLLIPPLAATAVYIFGVPGIPGTQPRSVLFGHVIAALIGFVLLTLFGHEVWVAALAAGLAGAAMNIVKLFHIPAVATAALVILLHPNDWVMFIVLLALTSCILVALGWAISKITRMIKYPLYW